MWSKTLENLNKLVVYRGILKDPIIRQLQKLPLLTDKEQLEKSYFEICHNLLKKALYEYVEGDIWKSYFINLLLQDENIFSLSYENSRKKISDNIDDLVLYDIEILKDLYNFNWGELADIIGTDFHNNFEICGNRKNLSKYNICYIQKFQDLKKVFSNSKDNRNLIENLANCYSSIGCGKFAKYKAFRWDRKKESLVGIETPDPILLSDLIGYESQKETLIRNTEAFLKGRKANNVLLFGDKGTGKSSSVKALLNHYSDQGLRLIEVSKYEMSDLNKILEIIKDRGYWFIIFMDDLSFEDFETEYKYLKAIIEGGVEVKPENVLIYATSNRRNLVKEKWSDRNDKEEVHPGDTEQEKLSLVDRFGITITYGSPDQDEYLEIVEKLAEKFEINIPGDLLRKKALQWELWNNGRSGRTAQQFINYLLSTV